MTVIAGVVSDGIVYLGGDRSAISAEGLTMDTIRQPKVWTSIVRPGVYPDLIAVGACDSYRMLQLLRNFEWPDNPAQADGFEYLTVKAVPALRKLVEIAGLPPDEDGPYLHGNVIVGYKGVLATIQGDLAVLETTRDYAAIGAGAPFALGSLNSTADRPASRRLCVALKATAEHSFAVRQPFDFVSTSPDDQGVEWDIEKGTYARG